MDKKKVDKTLDVRGLPCPTPTVMTGNALRAMKKGGILRVITNDMTTREAIPELCTKEGYTVVGVKEEKGLLNFLIEKN